MNSMTWADLLLVGFLLLIVFALGCWVGERGTRKPRKPDRWPSIPQDHKSQFDRIWRV